MRCADTAVLGGQIEKTIRLRELCQVTMKALLARMSYFGLVTKRYNSAP